VVAIDVTRYLEAEDNEVIQGDDGDCMMPSNAFLVITYKEEPEHDYFGTGLPQHPYPSIAGVHEGTLEVYENLTVSRLSTYPCPGTGGHIEYVRVYGNGLDRTASWDGYQGEWQTLTFESPFTLVAGETYTYEIRTGSYPQLHHRDLLEVPGGTIRCTSFTDANGKECEKAIPAFKLY